MADLMTLFQNKLLFFLNIYPAKLDSCLPRKTTVQYVIMEMKAIWRDAVLAMLAQKKKISADSKHFVSFARKKTDLIL